MEFRQLVAGQKQPESEVRTEHKSENSTARTSAALRITQRPRNCKTFEGSDAIFQAKIQGNPEPRITWFRNGKQLSPSRQYNMSYENLMATLHIHMALPEDAGHYTLLAANDIGKVTCSAHLVIEASELNDARLTSLHRRTTGSAQTGATTSTRCMLEENIEDGAFSSLKRKVMKDILTNVEVNEDQMEQMRMKFKEEDIMDETEVEVKHFKLDTQTIIPPVSKNMSAKESLPRNHYEENLMPQSHTYDMSCQNQREEFSRDLEPDLKAAFTKIMQRSKLLDGQAPMFTKMIVPSRASVGESASFDCKFTGDPAPTVTWYRENCPITTSQDLQITTSDISSSIVIGRVHVEDCGVFSVEAKNRAGTAKCFANLIVEAPSSLIPCDVQNVASSIDARQQVTPASIVCQQAPTVLQHLRDTGVKDGQPAILTCRISGVPAPLAAWYRNEKLVEESKYFTMAIHEDVYTLKISETFPEDEGTYMCVASNPSGTVNTIATLKVQISDLDNVPPFLSPMASLSVTQGSSAKFTTFATGHPTPKIIWSKDGDMIKSSRELRIVQDKGLCSLTICNAYFENTGTYTCQATNSNGQAKTSATLTIEST